MKAAFYTLGCKVNQYETEYMAELLKKAGFEIVSPREEADFYIVNSCTVTATADRKTRQNVRKYKRNHPDSAVILTGCMPQAFPGDAEELTDADIVISNKSDGDILKYINEYTLNKKRIIDIEKHEKGDAFSECSIDTFSERIRAFVKIEDGCDRFCSYCIIPIARGRVRSKPLDVLENEIKELAQNGIKEIVLVGINLSAYGKGENFNIADAVRVCCENPDILRVRLGSLEPDHITDEIISELKKYDKLCPQFHISLQSGCDRTLKNMNRHYTADEYRQLVNKLRNAFENATITTDFMVGFHDETEEDFKESLDFIKEIAFEKVHVFPYSERKGTSASKRGDSVTKSEKEERAAKAIAESEAIRIENMKSNLGKTVKVLFESNNECTYQGYTKNYIPVTVKSDKDIIGKELDVIIEDYDEKKDVCTGSIISNL